MRGHKMINTGEKNKHNSVRKILSPDFVLSRATLVLMLVNYWLL